MVSQVRLTTYQQIHLDTAPAARQTFIFVIEPTFLAPGCSTPKNWSTK